MMRRTDLALRALRILAARKERLQAAELAELLGSTRQFIPQVMTPLVRVGWISSGTGPSGGYELAAGGPQPSILQLIEVMEGPIEDGRCVLRDGPCAGESECALHEAWSVAREALIARLDQMPVLSGGEGNQ